MLGIFLGSSAMYGIGSARGGMGHRVYETNQLRVARHEEPQHVFLNRAAPASTMPEMVDEFELILGKRRYAKVFEKGNAILQVAPAHDPTFRIEKKQFVTPIDTFAEQSERLFRLAREAGCAVVSHGMPPLAKSSIVFYERELFSESSRRMYETVLQITADRYGARHYNYYDRCGGSSASVENGYVHTDLIHPGQKAHDIMYENAQREVDSHFGTYQPYDPQTILITLDKTREAEPLAQPIAVSAITAMPG